jgi:hypothetical protein
MPSHLLQFNFQQTKMNPYIGSTLDSFLENWGEVDRSFLAKSFNFFQHPKFFLVKVFRQGSLFCEIEVWKTKSTHTGKPWGQVHLYRACLSCESKLVRHPFIQIIDNPHRPLKVMNDWPTLPSSASKK